MYKKVLIPLDASREAEGVLGLIQGEVAPDGEIVLLYVVPRARTVVVSGHIILSSQQEETARSDAMPYLRALAAQQTKVAGRIRCETTRAESVAQGITTTAIREGVDLIAMFTHDHTGFARLIKGNTAREVRQDAPMDVRVFRSSEVAAYVSEVRPTGLGVAVEVARERKLTDILKSGTFTGVDIFQELSPDQVDKVTSLGDRLQLSTGDPLGKGGESGKHLFIIIEGETRLSVQSEVGEITVRVAGPGESFPMAALLESGTLITSGEALTDMDVLAIPSASLIQLCREDNAIGNRIYRAVAQLFASRYGDALVNLAASIENELENWESHL